MTNTLENIKVAILVSNGFEQSELSEPRKALDAAGQRRVSGLPSRGAYAVGTIANGAMRWTWISRSTPPRAAGASRRGLR
jgi:hypothetical protein